MVVANCAISCRKQHSLYAVPGSKLEKKKSYSIFYSFSMLTMGNEMKKAHFYSFHLSIFINRIIADASAESVSMTASTIE